MNTSFGGSNIEPICLYCVDTEGVYCSFTSVHAVIKLLSMLPSIQECDHNHLLKDKR